MKGYKPSYFSAFPILFTEVLLILIPGMLCLDIINARKRDVAFWGAMGKCLLVVILCILFAVIIWFAMSRIGKLFSKANTILTYTTIFHGSKTISLHSIRYITVHLPEMESKSSCSPLVLFLWADNEHYADIIKPSLRLIFKIKKQCPSAVFSFDDLKSRTKRNLIISAVFLILIPLMFFLD